MKSVPGMLSSTMARAELGPEKSIQTILKVRGAPCEEQDSLLVTRSTEVSRGSPGSRRSLRAYLLGDDFVLDTYKGGARGFPALERAAPATDPARHPHCRDRARAH